MSTCFVLLGFTDRCICIANLGHDCGCPTQMSMTESGSDLLKFLMLSVALGDPEKWIWRAYTSIWREKKKVLIETAHISLDIAFEVHFILTGTWNLPSFRSAPLRCPHLQFYLAVHLCNCSKMRPNMQFLCFWGDCCTPVHQTAWVLPQTSLNHAKVCEFSVWTYLRMILMLLLFPMLFD